MPTALAQQARQTTSTITTAVTQQSATQRSLESANRNLFSLTAASQTSVTLFHISKTVCAQLFFSFFNYESPALTAELQARPITYSTILYHFRELLFTPARTVRFNLRPPGSLALIS